MTKDKKFYLEKARAIRTLLCLLNSENKGLDEILEEIGGSKSTAMKRISELMEMNLVIKKVDPKRKRVIIYTLTEKGKKIAQKLQEIIKMMEGENK
jgi:DNA-binding MarR family transcriptional regulator